MSSYFGAKMAVVGGALFVLLYEVMVVPSSVPHVVVVFILVPIPAHIPCSPFNSPSENIRSSRTRRLRRQKIGYSLTTSIHSKFEKLCFLPLVLHFSSPSRAERGTRHVIHLARNLAVNYLIALTLGWQSLPPRSTSRQAWL